MYAGFVTGKHTAKWLGGHQKLNKMAYYLLDSSELVDMSKFPSLKEIQKFEGVNGPDGIKVKSPAQHEPWHYYDPANPTDNEILKLLKMHKSKAHESLKDNDLVRSAFELAWLAHAIVDGLTPAHHYPYEQTIEKLRGEGKESRNTKMKKMFIKGQTRRDTMKRNWRVLGAKGVLTSHINFEMGVTTVLIPMRVKNVVLSSEEIAEAEKSGLIKLFQKSAEDIYEHQMFNRFITEGWSARLGRDVKSILIPIIAKTVALSWYLSVKK